MNIVNNAGITDNSVKTIKTKKANLDLYPLAYKNFVNSKEMNHLVAARIIQRCWRRYKACKIDKEIEKNIQEVPKKFWYWFGF